MASTFNSALDATLKLGVIQTSLDPAAAWATGTKMSPSEEERAITEIRGYFAAATRHQRMVRFTVRPFAPVTV